MKEIIQSNTNKTIKFVKSLQMKKYRDEYNSFIIEGEKLIKEALEYKAPISLALLSESFSQNESCFEIIEDLEKRNIPVYYANDKTFKDSGETDTPQGIIAVVEKIDYNLHDILTKPELCIVLLNEVRDPGNAGTIIRTADACGLDAVVFSNGSVDIYNGKTIRATMGSLFHIPVIQSMNIDEIIPWFKEEGITSIGADPHSNNNCIDIPDYGRLAIVIGNESQGLGDNIISRLDMNVKIPMPGRAESLNAGIAASILMYEFSIRKKHVVM